MADVRKVQMAAGDRTACSTPDCSRANPFGGRHGRPRLSNLAVSAFSGTATMSWPVSPRDAQG